MKIDRFLNWIQDQMLNYPDICFKTLKMFMDKFYACLSTKQQKRWSIEIEMIREFTSKQLTIDETVLIIKTKNLEKELNNIKNNEAKPK